MEDFVEPGAVRHGNFINYYDFNSAADRLKLLPVDSNLWNTANDTASTEEPYLVLDVGCNAGNFTQLLHEFLSKRVGGKKLFILGIDIDPILIERANAANQFTNDVSYQCYNIMDYSDSPDNCINKFLNLYRRKRFDAVCCFSITMWIHLNNGDDGLKSFLDFTSELSEILVIEPQPWKCYQNAVRRMKRAKANDVFPLFPLLKMRNNVESDIKDYLKSEKTMNVQFESDPTKWKRRICFYNRKN